jgi:2-dehydropantoate 2-reductase
VLGVFTVGAPASSDLAHKIDVLWVATKARHLEGALAHAPPSVVGEALVIPLLNGVDHLSLLRERYRNVVAAAIRVESERLAPGVIRQKSPFISVDMVGADEIQADLREAGIECHSRDDELRVLWEKLTFLAPVALATTAFDAPVGAVRNEPAFVGCRAEAIMAAGYQGVTIDAEAIQRSHDDASPDMQSSMQKDVAVGRESEIEAVAGPIVRLGKQHEFPTPSTKMLVDQIHGRAGLDAP